MEGHCRYGEESCISSVMWVQSMVSVGEKLTTDVEGLSDIPSGGEEEQPQDRDPAS